MQLLLWWLRSNQGGPVGGFREFITPVFFVPWFATKYHLGTSVPVGIKEVDKAEVLQL